MSNIVHMRTLIRKIISGGQTGADQRALVAAKQLGIPTGGWMPRGFKTEYGPAPDVAKLYGLREHPSADYPARTVQNVKDADATLWVGKGDSRGFRCTHNACDKWERPLFVDPYAEELRTLIYTHHVTILNVAGPRASRDPEAHRRTAELLMETFK